MSRAEAVVRSPADGYTLLLVADNAFNALALRNLSFNFVRDLRAFPARRAFRSTWRSIRRCPASPSHSSTGRKETRQGQFRLRRPRHRRISRANC